jgi:hypothetical protein
MEVPGKYVACVDSEPILFERVGLDRERDTRTPPPHTRRHRETSNSDRKGGEGGKGVREGERRKEGVTNDGGRHTLSVVGTAFVVQGLILVCCDLCREMQVPSSSREQSLSRCVAAYLDHALLT